MSDRDLIARLAAALRVQIDGVDLYSELLAEADARALLAEAQPEPVGAIGEETGLHGKYIIHKASGEPVAYPCFVLRIDGSDAAAISVLHSYALATENAHLRQDILLMLAEAQPQPVEPTDEEIDAMEREHWQSERVVSSRGGVQLEQSFNYRDFARAVLARWGRPAPEPVSVAERPWEREGWCDAEGKCWWFNRSGVPEWQLAAGGPYGELSLPHWALPVPQEQADYTHNN